MLELKDSPSKRSKGENAELSRPDRASKIKAREKGKKPQGRKQKHEPSKAVYHNWFSPFLWNQIMTAAAHPSVGRSMSSRALAKVLTVKDSKTFSALAPSTIEGWIDRKSGLRPRWSDAALRRAELGNHQGHSNGGRRGVLVRVLASMKLS
jgi:hypothetical protein